MMIEVIPGVFWDTETVQQSDAARDWIQETVRPNLSEPTLDSIKRPDERTYENENVVVVEKQLYINDHNWARKGVNYTVTQK